MHRGGTCKYFPSGQRRPRRCWVPKRKDGWPRSASMAEACPPVSPPGVEDHLSDDDDQPGVGEMWCSPWLGQAWRQRLHFCPETFLNLPRPLSLYIDKLGKWIQTKSKKTLTFIKTESFFMSLTAAAEDFSRAQLMKRKWRGLLAWGQVERLGLACLSLGLLVRIPNLCVFKCGKLKYTLSLAFASHVFPKGVFLNWVANPQSNHRAII